ncbi:LOW QUALITY PROTEIN: delta(24)-sterol reductase-like [Bacillus rossius redtenbacheri]|uniref:LOW QUALITY PROTEIN: delta(24)-sterol reductase-like n=1 Tax=Bacillus rossius redtenbacheri TaxID=93214 RepID=UPI002FDD6E9B
MASLDSALAHFVTEYRWAFAAFFLLPASLLYELFFSLRNWVVFQLNTAPGRHASRVKHVQAQVKQWRESGMEVKMCTARPAYQTMSLTKPKYKKTLHNIHINLIDVLEVNTDKMTVRCEPMVTMGQLTATLNPLGLTIPIVPELDDLTVGGLVMGTGVESSSHKHGLFQHICVSYELVLADASVVTCSREEDPDLFYAIPWSYGTLGFLTVAEIKIVPAKKYVKLEYFPYHDLGKMVDAFNRESCSKKADFVEGLMYSKNEGVLMTGNMVSDCEPDKLNVISKWYKPWFYKHVSGFLKTGPAVEYIPLRDYYHRHTRALFWEVENIILFGNNVLFRYLFGWMMPPKVSLLKVTETEALTKLYETQHIVQDMLVPVRAIKDSIEKFHNTVEVYPLWLCPFSLPPDPGMVHPAGDEEEMYVDVGVYGIPRRPFEAVRDTRDLEDFVEKVKGFQMMYAYSYRTKEEYRRMFDHSLYDRVRERNYSTKAFPDVFEKVNRNMRA